MFRIGPLPLTPYQGSAKVQGSSGSSSGGTKRTSRNDQVLLSEAATAVPLDRSDLIAALKAVVSSPDYLPPSLPISRKLVEGALIRSN